MANGIAYGNKDERSETKSSLCDEGNEKYILYFYMRLFTSLLLLHCAHSIYTEKINVCNCIVMFLKNRDINTHNHAACVLDSKLLHFYKSNQSEFFIWIPFFKLFSFIICIKNNDFACAKNSRERERKRVTASIRIQLHCHNELMNMRARIIITTIGMQRKSVLNCFIICCCFIVLFFGFHLLPIGEWHQHK